jgi:hypothetical protein
MAPPPRSHSLGSREEMIEYHKNGIHSAYDTQGFCLISRTMRNVTKTAHKHEARKGGMRLIRQSYVVDHRTVESAYAQNSSGRAVVSSDLTNATLIRF